MLHRPSPWPLVAALLLASVPALAQRPAAPARALPSPVASVEGITEYRLDNGLRVLLFPDASKSTITVNITYLVGSRHEGAGETGMAHLLEHLLFKGTPSTPKVDEAFNRRGADYNASTSYDRTNYYETLPATGDNLEWALRFEAERMLSARLTAQDLASEMTVVRNELERGENDPRGILFERTLSTAYLWHAYGRDTIGSRSDVENVPLERLVAFYRRYYRPDNAVLVVAGRFEPERTLRKVVELFGKLRRPKEPLPATYTVEPVQDGERQVVLRRVGDVGVALAVYHVPEGAHPDMAALHVLTHALGSEPSGRLYQALVEPKKATAVYASSLQLRDPGVAYFGVEVREGQSLDEAYKALLECVEQAVRTPFSEEEVARARTVFASSYELFLTHTEAVALALSEAAAMGDWRLLFLQRDQIAKVTPEEVTRVAAAYLKSSNRTLGLFIPTAKPERAELPPRVDVAALVEGYKGQGPLVEGEALDPDPRALEARVQRKLVGGLKVALLPKRTRGQRVSLSLELSWGTEQGLRGRFMAAALAGDLLMRGTRQRSRQALRDELDRLKARVGVSASVTGASVGVETVRENLPAVLRLVAEVLKEPALEERELELLREEWLASLEEERNEPGSLAQRAWDLAVNTYPKEHPYGAISLEEELAETRSTTLEQVRAFHRDFFGASHGELAVVGDFDPAQVEALVGELFAGWKSPAPYERLVQRPCRTEPGLQVLQVPDKASALFMAGQCMELKDSDPDWPALLLGNYLLGGFTNSRLWQRVREREGLSYGVSSSLSSGVLDAVGGFRVSATAAPQNVEKLEAAIREELRLVLEKGFTAEELEKARTGLLEQWRTSRTSEAALAATLSNYLFYGRTLEHEARLEQALLALTPEQVRAALARHLDGARLKVVKAGDFKHSK